mgnify:CR=1 FL=1
MQRRLGTQNQAVADLFKGTEHHQYTAPFIRQLNQLLGNPIFYNGTLDCEPFLIESNDGGVISQTEIPAFPYFDHYSLEPGGTEPGLQSNSLLFLNENAVYGTAPTGSLYSNYWEKYVGLLYDPKTRLLDASAIISLADYNEMELNDIVQFRRFIK